MALKIDPTRFQNLSVDPQDDGVWVVTLNRPEKKNTLTDAVIQGIADGIDAANRSADVVAVVLRGSGDTLTTPGIAGGSFPTMRQNLRGHVAIFAGHGRGSFAKRIVQGRPSETPK